MVSIIIVNYRTRQLTESLIESLLNQKLPGKTEIIVVDNHSEDDSVHLLRSDFPEITVLDQKQNSGLAGGVNAAIRIARGSYYLILNPDVVALLGSVETLIKFMDNHAEVGMVGGKLVSPNARLQHSCFRFYRPMTIMYRRTFLGKTHAGRKEISRLLMKDFDHKSTKDVDWLMGSCMMVRALAVREVGVMDERFFLYFEDVDWCRRMWEHGWRVVYHPDAVFSHFYQRSSEHHSLLGIVTNRATREHIKSAIKYFLKYRGKQIPHRENDKY